MDSYENPENGEATEEITTDDIEAVEDRPLSRSEDVELDVREALQELSNDEQGQKTDTRPRDEFGRFIGGEQPAQTPKTPEIQAKTPQNGTRLNSAATADGKPIQPPASWSAEDKQWFMKQPIEAQRQFAKRTADMERNFHRVTQEAAAVKREYSDMDQVLAPYHDYFAERGITRAQAVDNLIKGNMALEKDLVAGIDLIARSFGRTFEDVFEEHQQRQLGQQNNVLHPVMRKVQELESELTSIRRQEAERSQAQAKSRQEAVIQELYAVRDEVGPDGNYLRPELHDEEGFVRPLVNVYKGLAQSFPQASPRELLLKAYAAVTGKVAAPTSPSQPQGEHRVKARQASLSVRGTPAVRKPQGAERVGRTTEDDVRIAAEELGLL